MDAKLNVMKLAIMTRMESGEELNEILKSYPKLSAEEKSTLKSQFSSKKEKASK